MVLTSIAVSTKSHALFCKIFDSGTNCANILRVYMCRLIMNPNWLECPGFGISVICSNHRERQQWKKELQIGSNYRLKKIHVIIFLEFFVELYYGQKFQLR